MNREITVALVRSVARQIMNGESVMKVWGGILALPSPQKTGTLTQQAAYAESKAKQLLEKLQNLEPDFSCGEYKFIKSDHSRQGELIGFIKVDGLYVATVYKAVFHTRANQPINKEIITLAQTVQEYYKDKV